MEHSFSYCALILCLSKSATSLITVLNLFVLHSFVCSNHMQVHTMYNELLRIARNLLETRENIKIESRSFYHIICCWFSWGLSNFFFLKKNPKWPIFKMGVFQNRKFSIFFCENFMDWCERHWCGSTYMVERLSNVSSETGKKCISQSFWGSKDVSTFWWLQCI